MYRKHIFKNSKIFNWQTKVQPNPAPRLTKNATISANLSSTTSG